MLGGKGAKSQFLMVRRFLQGSKINAQMMKMSVRIIHRLTYSSWIVC